MADKLSCPLLAAVGAEDQNPSPELGTQLRECAGASGQPVQVDVYEDAGHAFFADYRPSYRPGPAAELWSRVVPFLAEHLAG
jgi:carboxymethylenebutenolidase